MNRLENPNITVSSQRLIQFGIVAIVVVLVLLGMAFGVRELRQKNQAVTFDHVTEPCTLLEEWQTNVSTFYSDFVLHNDTMFAITRTTVYAINVQTGEVLWQNEIIERGSTYILVYDEGGRIAVEHDQRISVLDSQTGEMLWQTTQSDDPNARITDMVEQDSRIYAFRYQEELTVYDGQTGDVLWEKRIWGRARPDIAVTDSFLFATGHTDLVAMDPETGFVIFNDETFLQATGDMATTDGYVYVIAGREVGLYDLNSQRVVTSQPFRGDPANHYVLFEDRRLYLFGENRLTVFDSDLQDILFEYDLGNPASQVAVSEDLLVIQTNNRLYHFDTATYELLNVTSHKPRLLRGDLHTPLIWQDNVIIILAVDKITAYQLSCE